MNSVVDILNQLAETSSTNDKEALSVKVGYVFQS